METTGSDDVMRRLVALPDCDGAAVSAVLLSPPAGSRLRLDTDGRRLAWVEDVALIREQTVALVAIDSRAIDSELARLGRSGTVQIVVEPEDPRGPASRNAGPFTRALTEAVLNYRVTADEAPVWRPPSSADERGRGAAAFCSSVEDCQNAGIDMLVVVADQLYGSPLLYPYANYLATYLDLNVGVVSTSALSDVTPEALHAFIKDVYDSQSAASFGDGHLGFVTLIGDAYTDDNQTVMIPTYDGYGFTEVASDHYYACVSGDDDFEDVMIGRLSAGNSNELVTVVGKILGYMPLPEDDWAERVLLVAGTFYTSKDRYVELFDSYEELIPSPYTVDRVYRYDYETDAACIAALIGEFNAGALFVSYAGDGWISNWYQTFRTPNIQQLSNGSRLPIVLSLACNTGWFDNITEMDQLGSYDCMAEQFVNTSGRGAIACLAAPRDSDGGAFSTFGRKLYQAAFTEKCTFLGETIAVAKLLHIQDGGTVTYPRHYNLIGDPALIYRWDTEPYLKPDLALRPHETSLDNAEPSSGDDVTLTVTVRNESSRAASDVRVRVTRVSEAGGHSYDVVLPYMSDWSSSVVEVTLTSLTPGWHAIEVRLDPDKAIIETDETNNSFSFDLYVYPNVQGFPVNTGTAPYGPCVATLDEAGPHLILMDADASVRAIDSSGQTAWVTGALASPLYFGPEITPAAGDLDGDGDTEIVATRRSGLAAFDTDGSVIWQISVQEPIGAPVLADADRDGDLDIILATDSFFGSGSAVVAIDELGEEIWSYALPENTTLSTTPAVGDFDQDGCTDFAYGTDTGLVGAVSCAETPPVDLWGPTGVDGDVSQLALADVDDDGRLELIVASVSGYSLNAEDGTQHWRATLPMKIVSLSVGDIDADGTAETIIGSAGGLLYMIDGSFPGWSSSLSGKPLPTIAMADVRGDAEVELLAITDDGLLHILDSDGDALIAPIPVPGVGTSPFVADLDADGALEICAASAGQGFVYAFEFACEAGNALAEWPGPGGNAAHTGVLVQPFAGSFASDTAIAGRLLFTGDVVVEAGAKLSISAGSSIEFAGSGSTKLHVDGTLNAVGTPHSEIAMRAASGQGTVNWGGINVRPGGSASLSFCDIDEAGAAVCGDKAVLALEGCTLVGNTYGAYLIDCTFDAIDCTMSQSDSMGMYLSGGSGNISDCTFSANYRAGAKLTYSATHSISRSMFVDTINGDGLGCYRNSDAVLDSCSFVDNAKNGMTVQNSAPVLYACTISSNSKDGLYCHKSAEPRLSWCTIASNKIGVTSYGYSNPHLGDNMYDDTGYNSIYGNKNAAVANCSYTDFPILARHNWWGSATPDFRLFLGRIVYVPYLTAPPIPGRGAGTAEDVSADAPPASFRLAGNTPNPFNPTTTIAYDVPAGGGDIDLAVFDVAGRVVATLYSGYHEQGAHRVTWDGRDDSGRQVASGIYFVRLDASDFSASRKMVLLK